MIGATTKSCKMVKISPKINKYILASIALISIAMIIFAGMTAGQATVKETSSPLFEMRTTKALNSANIQEDYSNVYVLRFERSKAILSTNCDVACTRARCTHGMMCTSCDECPVQNAPSGNIEMVVMRDDVRCGVTECAYACSMIVCTRIGCGACTCCLACPVQASPGVGLEVNNLQ